MKALTLWQPWATLLVSGEKRVETRSWRPNPSHLGSRIAIHAARMFNRESKDVCYTEPFATSLKAAGYGPTPFGLPLGKIVGVATLVSVEKTEDAIFTLRGKELKFGNYEPKRWAWTFADMQQFDVIDLVPCSGSLGLWTLPPALDGLVEIRRARS